MRTFLQSFLFDFEHEEDYNRFREVIKGMKTLIKKELYPRSHVLEELAFCLNPSLYSSYCEDCKNSETAKTFLAVYILSFASNISCNAGLYYSYLKHVYLDDFDSPKLQKEITEKIKSNLKYVTVDIIIPLQNAEQHN